MTRRDANPSYWPDEWPRPTITSSCFSCGVKTEDIEENRVIVSPTGKAHYGVIGNTACGKDATGEKWWWPL